MVKKPIKKSDSELFELIEKKINEKNYIFLDHAKQRQEQRDISDLVVLNILQNKEGYQRKRNKVKDRYEKQYFNEEPQDWKYCIEGKDIDRRKYRIIITFTDNLMPIITVMNI